MVRYGTPLPSEVARRQHRRRSGPRVDWEADSACGDLSTRVAERYFRADGLRDLFEVTTARMICHACPVRVSCLAEAIGTPGNARTRWIRGGETPAAQAALRHEHLRSGESPRKIAERVIGHQLPPVRGAYGSPTLRAGEFTSPRLLP